MKRSIFTAVILVVSYIGVRAQRLVVSSPTNKTSVNLFASENKDIDRWYLQIGYSRNKHVSSVVERVDLGLIRNDQAFSELRFLKAGKQSRVNDVYTTTHGKRTINKNSSNEVVISFETAAHAKMNLILRAYDDGVAFRYEFPEPGGSFVVQDELTSYFIPLETKRWMEKWNPANEGIYLEMKNDKVQNQEWSYPALFQARDSSCFFLVHEADVNRNYCGTKLSNELDGTNYKLTFPNPADGRGVGASTPAITLPWKSPWRVIIVGGLSDIVESTLVDDVSTPSTIKDTDWIKPGLVSWNYWSDNHGTKDYQVVCAFADLAARMGWPYTLLDWEWDAMTNGGDLNDAVNYIRSKGVKPLMWYNSGGNHTWVPATPKDRMLTHENRVAEFTKLQTLGVAGVKIDFFESEKQNMIQYYLDILDDAASFKMMVYFHGCLVPRGGRAPILT